MDNIQKLLALDAALVACQGLEDGDDKWLNPEMKDAVKQLRCKIGDALSDAGFDGIPFGDFLDKQKEAVRLLLNSNDVFGGM